MDTTVSSAGLASRLKLGPPPTSYSAKSVSLKGRKVSFKGMRIVEVSQNAKTGPVSTTYMNQFTCPSSCPHLGKNCYAESGLVGMHTRRIEREAGELLVDMIGDSEGEFRATATRDFPALMLEHEAHAIKEYLTGKRKLRVHVVGDVVNAETAGFIGRAMIDHEWKHEQPAWTYTHRWREIPNAAWNGAEVLASVEKPEDVLAARIMGYASAITLPYAIHPTQKRYEYMGLTIVPCPAQAKPRKITCSACNLCSETAKLYSRGETIGFAVE